MKILKVLLTQKDETSIRELIKETGMDKNNVHKNVWHLSNRYLVKKRIDKGKDVRGIVQNICYVKIIPSQLKRAIKLVQRDFGEDSVQEENDATSP